MPKPQYIQHVKSILREGGCWTADALAARIECNEKTVRRCIEHLRDLERWPIESGKSGFILREPSLAEATITEPEDVAALALAYESLRKMGSSDLAAQIRQELMRVCRHSDDLGNVGWQNLGEVIQDRAESGEASVNHGIYGQLTLAILQKQRVEIRYRKLEEDHDFAVKVFPHKWVCRDQCWYLIAADLQRGGQRAYALPRISQVLVLPMQKDFQGPELDDCYEHAFGIWMPSDKDVPLTDVSVELTGYWARIARERHWHPSQRLEDLAPDRVRVHFRVNELVEVKSWVLKFGGAATVIAPEELRDLVLEELAEMTRNYDT